MDDTGFAYRPADAPDLSAVRRVLVVKLRHHGDVLLSSPVFSVLARELPQATVDALVYADTAPMLAGHAAIGHIWTVDRGWKVHGPTTRLRHEWALLRQVRAAGYDLVVNLTEGDRGAMVALASGAGIRVGLHDRRTQGRWLHRRAFTHRFRTDRQRRHMVEQNLDALRRLGIVVAMDSEPLTLVPTGAQREAATGRLRKAGWSGGDYVVVHPTSRWLFKCLPTPTVADVISGLQRRGFDVVLSAAPDPVESAMVADILGRVGPGVIDLSGRLDLPTLGAVIAGSRLFVGADSAPMHMAAACGVPVVAWFGPSNERVWRPWLAPTALVAGDQSCRPCGLDGCGGGKRSECLVGLESAQILARCDDLLGPE